MEKRDTSSITSGQQLEMLGMSKSIIEPQKVAVINLETPEDKLERRSIYPRQEDFNPLPATGVYSSLSCSATTSLSGIPDCFPPDNPVLLVPNVQFVVFIAQSMGDIYTYDQPNKILISMGKIDQDTATELQKFLEES